MSSPTHSRLLPLLSDLCERQLELESTLAELTLAECEVEAHRPGQEAMERFHQDPRLPGVILIEAGQFTGMISRRRFLEQMSRPYSLELFLKRPLKALYHIAGAKFLVLPSNTSIVVAARQALQRSPELLDEPILVHFESQTYRLLDMHQLLVAQSQIHELATQLLNQLYRQLETASLELHRLATADSLTQVANRRQFDEYFVQEWWRMAREQTPLSLILCDIDYFKAYNDIYGHLEGDRCLKEVAVALQKAVKRPADLMARYGGEEFAVILPNTPGEGAMQVAQAMRTNLKSLKIPHCGSLVDHYVTLSVGIASVIPNHELTPETLFLAADQALYQAKKTGRDRIILKSETGIN